jgi:hypothetical protein
MTATWCRHQRPVCYLTLDARNGSDADLEYSVFASPNFDANEYANAVLAGEPYPVTKTGAGRSATGSRFVKEDVSVAIGRLDSGIEDISKRLKTVVCSVYLRAWA